eukprot:TRINITY_DN5808_c0_g1_i2.p1 TRINITY_DN5808_c0_g1~~TRINITY_DN5808_c0_g1_i2.p1  ORF type:complete len:843 (+),score=203.10 TRINITY_DN5808_c0_g1_i2:55-2583(+)
MGCSASQPAGTGALSSKLAQAKGSSAVLLLRRELQAGLDPNAPDANTCETPLATAIRLRVPLEGLEALLKAGARAGEEEGGSSSSSSSAGPAVTAEQALFALLQDNSMQAKTQPTRRDVAMLLVKSGLSANVVDAGEHCQGNSLLVASLKAGEVGLAQDLLAARAMVQASDSAGNTGLHVAAALADGGMIELLAQNGADLKAKNGDGHSPVMCCRLGAIAPELRLSPAGGWAQKELLDAKVVGKADGRAYGKGEEVWRCPRTGDCMSAVSATPPTFPSNHAVAAKIALMAGDAYNLADAVEGAWLAGEAPPMKPQDEAHPDIMRAIVQLVQVLQAELRAGLEARDRSRLSAGLEMLRYAKVAQLPEEEAATRILVSLELEQAIASNEELQLKQAILSAQQYEHTGSKLYTQAQLALEALQAAKRVEQAARQLANAASRGDLETVHGLLQAGKKAAAAGDNSLASRPEFADAEAALAKAVRVNLQRAVASCSKSATRKACAEACRYGLRELPEYKRLWDLRKLTCLESLKEASEKRDQAELLAKLRDALEDPELHDSIRQEETFCKALEVYKELLALPPYFEEEQVVSQVSLKCGGVKRENVESERLREAFQELMDLTYRRVRTKDRRGDVPTSLHVKEVVVVKNLPNFVTYAQRREDIRKQCQESPPKMLLGDLGNDRVCKTFAVLPCGQQFHSVWREANDLPADPIDPSINEFYLFHGTKPEAAAAITEGNFRLDLAGSNAGTLYGRGLYFSESTGKSDEYSIEDSRGLCCMLVCRVTLGRILYTDEEYPNTSTLVRCCVNGTNHSVLGDREKIRSTFREMIVFDADQAYPEFLVWYKRIL